VAKFKGIYAACLECHKKATVFSRDLSGIRYLPCPSHPKTELVIVCASGKVVTGWFLSATSDTKLPDFVAPPPPPIYERTFPERPEENVVGYCPICYRKGHKRDTGYGKHYFCRKHPRTDLVMVDLDKMESWIGQGWSTTRRPSQVEYIGAGNYRSREFKSGPIETQWHLYCPQCGGSDWHRQNPDNVFQCRVLDCETVWIFDPDGV
jgi:hypothetical protein